MGSIINLKRKPNRLISLVGKKEIIVLVLSVILTTVGIKASDNLFSSPSEESEGKKFCSSDMIFVNSSDGGFCIDKYEASAGSECAYANPENQSETRENLNNNKCLSVSVRGSIPWRNISQNQAAIACAKAGKRLPLNKEWLQAALGTPDMSHGWTSKDCQVAKNWGEGPGPSGSGENCRSSAGAFDMIGNAWEWVEGTIYDGEYNGKPLPEQGHVAGIDDESLPSETTEEDFDPNYYEDYFWIKKKGTRGIARGGYWDNKSGAGQYAVYMVTPPSFAGIGVGFRCVK